MSEIKTLLRDTCLPNLAGKYKYFSIQAVRDCLRSHGCPVQPATLNSYLTELVQAKNLFSAGRGWYSRIADPYQLDRKPVQEVVTAMEKQYPLLAFACWSTEQVKTHMHHLLNRFVTFVFTESDAMTTLYEFLRDSGYDAWLNPRGKESRRFSVGEKTIVIRRNITEEPVQGHYAAIEKILVDLYAEAEDLNLMDRDEYQRMQQNAIESGRVEVATMIRYAKRRKLAPTDAFPWLGSITGTY